MSIWSATAWGLVGGLCVEALALHALIHKAKKWTLRKPIPQGLAAYLISVIVRAGVGAGLAAAAAGSGQVSGSFGAFGLGVAAPLIIEKLSRTIPVDDASPIPDPNKVPKPRNDPEGITRTGHPSSAVSESAVTENDGAGDAR